MTDVEGVVNQVVVGQSDALGITRCSRCELEKIKTAIISKTKI